eukprot:CAMPEP_0185741772 /NCGR_PEP_ID=MMETSP1171-20130828/39131_1 /TAXON_ID=374046 /ORGANISM="Helicotheca tamensis, Strain CCMP826" /LENGTH=71 /DNA_ID=CAMNT_0028413757 /DNA_START=917 /DNA_END=1132 /DNA_ORIENTATION=+
MNMEDFWTSPILQGGVLCMWILVGLLTFWLVQVVQAVVRISVKGEELEDPRSDDEAETVDQNPPIAHKKKH